MSGARDWFVSDADVQELFRVVRGQLRQTIIEAIRVAARSPRSCRRWARRSAASS